MRLFMLRMGLPFAMLLLTLAGGATAAILDYKPLGMEVKTGDRLVIHGFEGDVVLLAGKTSQMQVRVRQENPDGAAPGVKQVLDEWNFSMQRVGDVIDLQVQSPQTRAAWRQILMSGGEPKFSLEIVAPSIPVEVAWRQGKIKVDNWAAPIRTTLQDGSVMVTNGQGDVKIVGQQTEIIIKNRVGHVRLETYNGKIVADSIKGALEVENFTGDTQISGNDGPLDLKSYKGNWNINGGRGRIDFEMARSQLKINGFAGDLKGTADQGSVTGRLVSAAEVRVTTQEGPVTLDLPDSGANIYLSSVDGAVQGPAPLKSEQLAGARVLRGRLKGKNDGSIVVRTQSGAIRVK